MRTFSIALAFSLGRAAAISAPDFVTNEFLRWTRKFGKDYVSERAWRSALTNYEANKDSIADLQASGETAEYAHSIFSDVDPQTFARTYLPFVMDPAVGKRGGGTVDVDSISSRSPNAVDWRSFGAVSPVKNQKSCGSCWAESAVSNIESLWFLANRGSLKNPPQLSVQQVIECDAHDYACYGGYPRGAYLYVIERGGITSEANYPYNVDGHTVCLANQTYNETCGDGICDDPPLTNYCDETCSDKSTKHPVVARIGNWVALPSNEDQIAAYVAQHGPVSVGLDAAGGGMGVLFPWLQFYKSGIANPKRCTDTINHGVLVVGYGVENDVKYWIVKNSWGEKWGESGYFRLVRGLAKCAIHLMATSAVVDGQGIVVADAISDRFII